MLFSKTTLSPKKRIVAKNDLYTPQREKITAITSFPSLLSVNKRCGFKIPAFGFRIPLSLKLGSPYSLWLKLEFKSQSLSRFRIPWSEFRISKPRIPGSKSNNSKLHKQNYSGFRNMDFLTWGTRDDSQRRLLAQHSVATLLQQCSECLQHCSSIATLRCSKNPRCESFRVTSPSHKREQPCAQDRIDSTVKYDLIRCRFKQTVNNKWFHISFECRA